MNRLFTAVILALFGCAGCRVTNHSPGLVNRQQDRRQLCDFFFASHRLILESLVEVELYTVKYETYEWHGALKSLEVSTQDASGHPRNPSSVLQSTLDKLVQVDNAAERMRLEYLLLGSRVSLEERRSFDSYCVVVAVTD